MSHVFISYVRDNAADVERLCAALTSSGVKVWLDRSDIKPGEHWREAIRKAIRSGDYFIACFSSEYQARRKSYMNEELKLAIEELQQSPTDRTWFIPVLFSECDVPASAIGSWETLLDINWVPLYADWEDGVRRILSVIKPVPLEIQRRMEALRSADKEIRRSAARALGDDSHPAVPSELKTALSDSDKSVQEEAIDSLLKSGRKGVNTFIDAVKAMRGDLFEQLISALLSRVALKQSKQAATVLSAVYRSGADEQRQVMDESIKRLKESYQYDYDIKMSEFIQFEGFMGEHPVREERALRALELLVARFNKTKVS